MQIASLIVDALPSELLALQARLKQVPGVQVHAVDPQGRLVVTVESDDDAAPQTHEQLRTLPGVMSVSLVFNQFETAPDEELVHVQEPGAHAP